jgi:hypothetical protein
VAAAEVLLFYGTSFVIYKHVIPVLKRSQQQFNEIFSGRQLLQDMKLFQ